MTSSTELMEVVSTRNLNQLSCSQNFLLLLRGLSTSDLAFTYMCLKEETVEDICNIADTLIQLDDANEPDPTDYTRMTVEEKAEYLALVENMRIYADSIREIG